MQGPYVSSTKPNVKFHIKDNQQAKWFYYSINDKLSQRDITFNIATFLLNLLEILMQPYECIFTKINIVGRISSKVATILSARSYSYQDCTMTSYSAIF